ncbi:MAG: maleylpyruvate isomerase family mycothiol-dependent enzyme [Actinomycetota bacterium]|nr:maleylpyruvate isomerase family mycothiol-dependent enzyme [Actinomycetota bacterium]
MEPAAHLEHLAADGALLAAAARGHLDLLVPSCPEWVVADLVTHTGEVYGHKIPIVRDGARPTGAGPLPPPGADLLDWYDATLGELLGVLRGRDPAEKVWTWYPPEQSARFWYRRMAQETVIHRADAELAVGIDPQVDRELALDGIDELLVCFVGAFWGSQATGGEGETVALRSDGRAWHVTIDPDAVAVTRGAHPAGTTVSAPPRELLLYLWGRLPVDVVDITGDRSAAQLLREILVETTQ